MKISTKGRYAVRLMLDLALHNNGDYITVKEIAGRQDISEKYLEQIISILNRAGYLKSTRGAQGGYQLAKDPSDYTIGMILRLTEGSLSPIECVECGEESCKKASRCASREVWVKVYEAILGVVDNIKLSDLVDRQMALNVNDFVI